MNQLKSLGIQKYNLKVDGLDDTPPKVNGPKNAVLKLIDLDDTPPKVNGPKNAV